VIIFLAWLWTLTPKYEVTCDSSTAIVEGKKIGFQNYLPVKSIVEALDVNFVFDQTSQRMFLAGNGHQVVMIPDINVVKCDSAFRNLFFGPRTSGGTVYFPADEVTSTIAGPMEKLAFLKEIKEVPLIKKIILESRADSSVIKFEWERPVDFDVQMHSGRVVVEIDGRYTATEKLKPAGEIKGIKVLPYNTYTRLEIEVGDVNSALEKDNEVLLFKKITTRIARIVIDPGHGGIDPGAVGKKGLYEKDANLLIARRLQALIKDSLGVNATLSRESDVYLSLKERTDLANRMSADLFISVHCNASPKSSKSRGFETYFLSEARTNEARAVAAIENASLKFDGVEEPKNEIEYILYDLAQNAFLQESNSLAEFIQNSAERLLSIPARGVSQAGFYVLRGAFMPAVLVECAFLSNPEEEKLLKTADFKEKLSNCIFTGLKEYVVEYERRMNN
jgi:N-acetylmuramoyl-L-alanine amidase